MGDERRRHHRVRADLPFRLVDERGKEESFDLIDLSESGARIRCAHAIGAMTRVRVNVLIPGRYVDRPEDVRLVTTGVVVWSHRGEDGRYDTGVFFSELEEGQREVLHAFVRASA